MYVPAPNNNPGNTSSSTLGLHIDTNDITGDKQVHEFTWVNKRGSKSTTTKTVADSSGWRPPTNWSRSAYYAASGAPVRTKYTVNRIPFSFYANTVDDNGYGVASCQMLSHYNYYSPLDLQMSNLSNRSLTEAMVKLKNMKINLGEALGESRSTVRHLSTTVSTVTQALLALRKGNFKKALEKLGLKSFRFKDTSRSAAARWLELQFAWLPLLSDIYGASQQLQEGFRKKAQLFSVVRTVSTSADTSRNKPSNSFTIWNEGGSTKLSARTKLYGRIRDSDIANLTTVGLTDPLQVAWALVPFSFVIDWFLPVGNFIEALGATKGIQFVGGFTTLKITGSYSATFQYAGHKYISGSATASCSFLKMRRTKYNAWPFPHLYIKSPFSLKHVADVIALLRQLSRR